VQSLSRAQVEVFAELTKLVTDDPLLLLQYGNAAEIAQDYQSAIGAYESYLDLQPNSANADQVEKRIDTLKAVSGIAPTPEPKSGSADDSEGG
jgi:tetratricopeptide (TPR) repeat protein